jgi:hypothetical protein
LPLPGIEAAGIVAHGCLAVCRDDGDDLVDDLRDGIVLVLARVLARGLLERLHVPLSRGVTTYA